MLRAHRQERVTVTLVSLKTSQEESFDLKIKNKDRKEFQAGGAGMKKQRSKRMAWLGGSLFLQLCNL